MAHAPEVLECLREGLAVLAEVDHRLALQGRGLLVADARTCTRPAGKHTADATPKQRLEPPRLRGVVDQDHRLRDVAGRQRSDERLAEPLDQRLGVRRVHEDPAAPGLAQPVILGGVETGGTDDAVGLSAGGGVQVDAAHDRGGAPDVVLRRVPLVVAGVVGDVGLGDGLPGLLDLLRRRRVAQRLGRLHHFLPGYGHLPGGCLLLDTELVDCLGILAVAFDRWRGDAVLLGKLLRRFPPKRSF